MAINPETNKFEMLKQYAQDSEQEAGRFPRSLVLPNGEPVPEHWTILTVGENIQIKSYNFRVVYMNDSTLVLEPTGPVLVGKDK